MASRRFDAFGWTSELQSIGTGQAALERCEEQIHDAEARLTRFIPDSELAQLNASDGRYLPVSPQLFGMLEAALWAFAESEGLVNVALARSQGEAPAGPPLPDVLLLDLPNRCAALAPSACLDLGLVARGVMADLTIDELGDNASCNLGGTIRLRGAGPEGAGWPVALCDESVIALSDGAVSSLAVAKRRWGRLLPQLIDPRTHMPARTDVAEVSVISDSALQAETYATCAVLLGAAAARDFLERRNLQFALIPSAGSSVPSIALAA